MMIEKKPLYEALIIKNYYIYHQYMIYVGNFTLTKEFAMKPNRFLLAAIFGLALAFTFSCSSDDGGPTRACRFTESYNGVTADICKEISGERATKYSEEEYKEECEEDNGKYYGSSCPSGSLLKCKGHSGTSHYFIYSSSTSFKNCDEFENWWYDGDDE